MLVPAIFIAIVPMIVLRDILAGRDVPFWVFAAIGAVVFAAVFLQLTFRETSDRQARKKQTGTFRPR